MSQTIQVHDGLNYGAIARVVKKDDKDWISVIFPRTRWALFENKTYYEDFESTQNNENEYYNSIYSIPKYSVHKNGKKISVALPRLDNHDKPFLFIPKGWSTKRNMINTKRDKYKYSLSKEYYIFQITDEYKIEDKAVVYFSS